MSFSWTIINVGKTTRNTNSVVPYTTDRENVFSPGSMKSDTVRTSSRQTRTS